MAGSSGNLLDHHAQQLIAGIPDLGTVLDIGPGYGKYGRMVRELQPNAYTIGMEIDSEYVDRFGLRDIYNTVRIDPAVRLLDNTNFTWDLVILGDVLEHMRKSEGMDVLHYLVYRAKYIWIQWPMRYIQGEERPNDAEAHVSVWTETDIRGLNADYVKVETPPLEGYAINGYPNAGRRVEEILGVFPK